MKKIWILAVSIVALVSGAFIYYFVDAGFIRSYVPDFLWSVSFVYALYFIQERKNLNFILIIIFGALFELMQYFGFMKGTADIMDILFYIIGGGTVYLIRRRNDERVE